MSPRFAHISSIAARTSQFVAVRGTLENNQPSREGLSEASRMYWSVRIMVSPPKSHQRLCMSESRYGCSWCQSKVQSSASSVMHWKSRRLTGWRLCVRSCVPISGHGPSTHCIVATHRDGFDIRILNQTSRSRPGTRPASHQQAHACPWFRKQHGRAMPSYQGAIGAQKEWKKTMLRKLTNNEASAEWKLRQEDGGTGWRLERAGVLKVNLEDRKGHSITSACRAGVLRCGTTLARTAALDVDNFLQTRPPPNDPRNP